MVDHGVDKCSVRPVLTIPRAKNLKSEQMPCRGFTSPKSLPDEPNSKRRSPAAVPHAEEHERNECLTMLPANPNNGEVRGNIRPILMLTGFVSR